MKRCSCGKEATHTRITFYHWGREVISAQAVCEDHFYVKSYEEYPRPTGLLEGILTIAQAQHQINENDRLEEEEEDRYWENYRKEQEKDND